MKYSANEQGHTPGCTCGTFKETNLSFVYCIIESLHEVLLDGVGLVGEGWECTGNCTHLRLTYPLEPFERNFRLSGKRYQGPRCLMIINVLNKTLRWSAVIAFHRTWLMTVAVRLTHILITSDNNQNLKTQTSRQVCLSKSPRAWACH